MKNTNKKHVKQKKKSQTKKNIQQNCFLRLYSHDYRPSIEVVKILLPKSFPRKDVYKRGTVNISEHAFLA